MFTGLQNDNWVPINGEFDTPPGFDIIQPVLQYGGESEDGGGDYWALASWYVTLDENVLYSPPQELNDGDEIFGNMSRTGPTSWFIGGFVDSAGINASISVTDPRLAVQNWAYVTLEVYQIDSCDNDFPPSNSPMKFTGLELYEGKNQVTPQWQSLNNGGQNCVSQITVVNPSSVTITF